VPICSTVLLVLPSIPTHGDDQLFSPGEQLAAGCVHEPMTWLAPLPPTA
jgi:hypothetical protein